MYALTSFILYYIHCGRESMLSIELEVLIRQILPWHKVYSTAKLLAIYKYRLQRQDKILKKQLSKYGIWYWNLCSGDIILLDDIRKQREIFYKFTFKWLNLYQIYDLIINKSIYILEKLDRLQLAGLFASNRLMKFHPRQQLQLNYALNLDCKEISNLMISLETSMIITFLTNLLISWLSWQFVDYWSSFPYKAHNQISILSYFIKYAFLFYFLFFFYIVGE